MAYKHGTYGEYGKTISQNATQTDTIAVYVGVAPVHLIRGWKEKNIVNNPVKLTNMDSARRNMGYSDAWDQYTLCEAFSAHFANPIRSAGTVVAINVLDPDAHKKAEDVTREITFLNGTAKIESTDIILDTLTLDGLTEGADYNVEYDDRGIVNVLSLTEAAAGAIQATYSEVDTSLITADNIIGGKTESGTYSGLGAVDLVYGGTNLIPNIIAAPGFSHEPDVYKAMLNACRKINGHWDAFVNADIPIDGVQSIDEAIKWKEDNDYSDEFSKAYYPKWQLSDGTVYHLSTIATWLMMLTDSENNGIPMETPSNEQIPSGKQYFGEDSMNRGFDQQTANRLNEKGITTAVYWGGINVLWGPHTAAYDYDDAVRDARSIFDNSIRMMMYVSNSFQQEWALTIDSPMTRAMADTIKNREQEKVDALVTVGALIGNPVVEFIEGDNSNADLVEGNFTWRQRGTPTPPFKSGTINVAYTDEGFSTYYEGGGQ